MYSKRIGNNWLIRVNLYGFNFYTQISPQDPSYVYFIAVCHCRKLNHIMILVRCLPNAGISVIVGNFCNNHLAMLYRILLLVRCQVSCLVIKGYWICVLTCAVMFLFPKIIVFFYPKFLSGFTDIRRLFELVLHHVFNTVAVLAGCASSLSMLQARMVSHIATWKK